MTGMRRNNGRLPIIGITGGIGSGKSYVAKLAAKELGLYIIDSDSIAREQMQRGGASYGAVTAKFGDTILGADGEIDRAVLASIVFGDEKKLQWLNELTHPLVLEAIHQKYLEAERTEKYNGVLVESALVIEAGYVGLLDAVWYVYAPQCERRKRLAGSRGYSEDKITLIFNSQQSDESFRAVSDYVIQNSGTMTDEGLKTQVCDAWQYILKKDADRE